MVPDDRGWLVVPSDRGADRCGTPGEPVVYRSCVPVVDIVLVVVILAAALHGLRLGALVQLLSFGGFWLGLVLGALLVVAVVPSISSLPVKAAVTLAAVLGLGLVLGVVGRVLGRWTKVSVRRLHLGPLDSAAGVVVAIVAVLLSAWLLGSVLSQSRFTAVSNAIQRSTILRALDSVLPPVPSVFAQVQTFLSAQGFPPVFTGIAPPLHGSVPTPSSAWAQALAAGATGSTYKVLGVACGVSQEGTSFVVAPGTVLTNAHVVAGERATDVVVGGFEYPATVVLFDPKLDVALLRTGAPMGPALRLSSTTVGRGTQGAVVGYPENGSLTITPAAVAGEVQAQGRDIYGTGLVTRSVYQLDAQVRPGNSGSPLVAPGGAVVGVVFSRSTTDAKVGYALTSPEVLARVRSAEQRTAPVSTGACVQD